MSTLSWLMLEQTQAGFILVLSLISLFGRAQLHSCCWSHIHYLHFSVSQVTQHRKQINEDWNIQNIWGRCNSVIVTAHLQCTRVPVGKIINIYWAWRRYWAGCCQMSPPTSSYPSAWVRSHVNLMQPNIWLAFWDASARCQLTLSFSSPLYLSLGLPQTKCRIFTKLCTEAVSWT